MHTVMDATAVIGTILPVILSKTLNAIFTQLIFLVLVNHRERNLLQGHKNFMKNYSHWNL